MKVLLAVMVSVLIGGSAGAAGFGDPTHAVCVSTIDDHAPRFDSLQFDEASAQARVAAILAGGWTTEVDSGRMDDFYPARSIVKVRIVDLRQDSDQSCVPITSR